MKFCSILFTLLLIFVSPVSATNFYAGVNAGLMNQSGDFSVIDNTLYPSVGIDEEKDYQTPDDSSLTYSLFAGYKLASDLFLEVGFAKNDMLESETRLLASVSGNSAIETSETDYYYAAFVGLWPIHNNWAFNARLGFSVWDIDYTQTEVDTTVLSTDPNYVVQEQALSDNTSAMLVGFGISYGFSQNLEFKLSVENHFVDFSFTNLELDYEALSVTIGTVYHF